MSIYLEYYASEIYYMITCYIAMYNLCQVHACVTVIIIG